MNSIVTKGIEISVNTLYASEHSLPSQGRYFFVYFITITNTNDFSVKLLKRHWDITDAFGTKREVDGEGVVGETPVLEPGESFSYNSGCDLNSDIGKMSGYYTMEKLVDGSQFAVTIPEFQMVVPARLN